MDKTEELNSKGGTNRDGGRGASQDAVGGAAKISQLAFSFFGSADGHNTDCQNNPVIKAPTKSTLDAPSRGGA